MRSLFAIQADARERPRIANSVEKLKYAAPSKFSGIFFEN
jgi:hypothetical protein